MKKLLLIIGCLLISLPCYALTYTNTLSNGTIADADDVMDNFNDVKTAIESFNGSQITDGSITNSKISGSAAIDTSKIEGGLTDVNLQTFNTNYKSGVNLVYEAVANATVSAGEIMINGKYRRNTSATDTAWTAASTTASGLDTGSEAASTWYYVYVCADDPNATTFTIATSTSSSAPSYSGATNYRLIGRLYNDGSSNITSVINTADLGVKFASGKFVGSTTSTTVTIGFQPVYVKVFEGDANPANGENVTIIEATQDLDIDNLSITQTGASDTFTSSGLSAFTTTGFTCATSNTYIYHFIAFGY